jgi:hypothetical protein
MEQLGAIADDGSCSGYSLTRIHGPRRVIGRGCGQLVRQGRQSGLFSCKADTSSRVHRPPAHRTTVVGALGGKPRVPLDSFFARFTEGRCVL